MVLWEKILHYLCVSIFSYTPNNDSSGQKKPQHTEASYPDLFFFFFYFYIALLSVAAWHGWISITTGLPS